jgi:hypothetical protein
MLRQVPLLLHKGGKVFTLSILSTLARASVEPQIAIHSGRLNLSRTIIATVSVTREAEAWYIDEDGTKRRNNVEQIQ